MAVETERNDMQEEEREHVVTRCPGELFSRCFPIALISKPGNIGSGSGLGVYNREEMVLCKRVGAFTS